MGMGGQLHALVTLTTGNRHETHSTGSWVGPRAGLDGCGKSHPPPGFEPRSAQPVGVRSKIEINHGIHAHPLYFVYPDLLVAVCEKSYGIRV
jgi:hypothetical protein